MFKDGAYYNAISPYLKEYFGHRMAKIAIDAGFTCPNRDGNVGTGGCIFCSADGSGYFSQDKRYSISEQINLQLDTMKNKWRDAGYIAYFQSFTNTYAPVGRLAKLYEEALAHPEIQGLVIATRPDCLSDEILYYLQKLNNTTFLWIELGLQTSNDNTAVIINRGYPLSCYDSAVEKLVSLGIRVVTHLIAGLPGECENDFINSVKHICHQKIFGIKLHLLTYLYGTRLGDEFLKNPDAFTVYNKEEYVSLICDALEYTAPEITIHRLTGDAPAASLIAPLWARNKHSVLNAINHEMKLRGHCQGSLFGITED